MIVTYRNADIRKCCTDGRYALRKHGARRALLIARRVQELLAADSVEEMIEYGIGRCHPLRENRSGQYALDLDHPWRMVFTKAGVNAVEINVVRVEDFVDYH